MQWSADELLILPRMHAQKICVPIYNMQNRPVRQTIFLIFVILYNHLL